MRAVNGQISLTGHPSGLLPWLTMLVIGLVLTLLAVVLYYRAGGHSEANTPLSWKGSELRLTRGQGAVPPDDPNALVIQAADAGGIVLWSPPRWINADLYGELAWEIMGLDGRHPLRPIWQTADDSVRQATEVTASAAGRATLQAEPSWGGAVIAQGIFIPGPLAAPVIVRRLALQPTALTPRQWLEQLWKEWTAQEDWSQRSINFAAGATSRPLGSLVLLAVVCASLSGVLYGWWLRSAGQRLRPAPFVALFLLGWLLLDLRWQWELSARVEHTVQRFAGKDATDRRLADLDGDLYRFLLEVRRHLPEQPVRLFIMSDDPPGFTAGRARYHLLPHNGYMGFSQPPNAAHEGDYVLVLAPLPELRFNPAPPTLEWTGGHLAVERLYAAPAGALFRVLGADG
ncbi:MAG: hypothetical protein H6974_00395 [Gammaproteobacteria bacterium]|nr:hypothetical protein [Gammaproteobacteria bacterium]